MSERFPWEEGAGPLPPPPETGAPGPLPLQMELEPPPAAGAQPTSAGAGPASEPEARPVPEPPVIPPGDPQQSGHAGTPPQRPAARERPVARKEYYSIGEVSELAGLPAHVLRYWESQFPVLNPSKNRSGNRAYQRKEIKLILLVKHLLYEEKYTVEGAKAKLDQLRRGGLLAEHTARALDAQTLALLREDVARLRELLASG
jgi:DNA-binding transcriptional MerR regulator